MNAKKEAREIDRLKDSGREFDGLRRVQAQVAKVPRAVFSLRLAPAELEEIANAATELGLPVSDFVRSAALSAARGKDLQIESDDMLADFYAALRQLEEVSRALLDSGITVRRVKAARLAPKGRPRPVRSSAKPS